MNNPKAAPNDPEAYRALVERLAETNSPEVFSNSRAEHAAVIYEIFFKYAKSRVRIFCRSLSALVFKQPVIERMEMALLNGVNVDIISQEQPESEALVKAVEQWKSRGLSILLLRASPDSKAAKVT